MYSSGIQKCKQKKTGGFCGELMTEAPGKHLAIKIDFIVSDASLQTQMERSQLSSEF